MSTPPPQTEPRVFRHRRLFVGVLLLLLLGVNAYAFSRPWLHEPALVMDWRKGPLVKDYSPYSTNHAGRIIWPVMAGMLDLYLLGMLAYNRWVRRRVNPGRRGWVDGAAACLALLVVFVAGEATTRYVIFKTMYLQYHPDPELFWYNRPNLRNHTDVTDEAYRTTNALGFRMTREVAAKKAKDEYRIFVIGDSSTFGLGVNDAEAYAQVIERTLSKLSGRKVTVINTASPGHTTFQGMVLLKRHGLDMQPDLVLWSYNNDSCLDMVMDKDRIAASPTVRAVQRVLYRSDVYLLARRVVLDAVYGWQLEKYRKLYPKEKNGWVRRVPFEDYKSFLFELLWLGRQRGFHVFFIRMPLNRPMCEQMPIYYTSFDMKYRNYLTDMCQEYQLNCANFESMFDEWSNTPDLYLPGHLFHPSVKGHRIIGEHVARAIFEKGLMTPPRPQPEPPRQ